MASTPEGKAISSQNSLKHGRRSRRFREVLAIVAAANRDRRDTLSQWLDDDDDQDDDKVTLTPEEFERVRAGFQETIAEMEAEERSRGDRG